MLNWFFTKSPNILTQSPKNISARDVLNLRKYIIEVIVAYPLSKLLGKGTANKTTFLRGDGVWAEPTTSSGGITDGDKGDITVTGTGTTWTIDNLAVTDAKINSVTATKVTEDSNHRFVTDAEKTTWNAKQEALVSATNIKTINSTSLLGSGDIAISSGLTQQQIEGLI